MRITFKCVTDGRRHMIIGNEVVIGYFAEFGVAKETPQRFFGEIKLQCVEPMFFKTGRSYTIDINEFSGLVLPINAIKEPEIPDGGRNN